MVSMYLDEGVAEEGVLAREVLKVPAVAGDARQAEARPELREGTISGVKISIR